MAIIEAAQEMAQDRGHHDLVTAAREIAEQSAGNGNETVAIGDLFQHRRHRRGITQGRAVIGKREFGLVPVQQVRARQFTQRAGHAVGAADQSVSSSTR